MSTPEAANIGVAYGQTLMLLWFDQWWFALYAAISLAAAGGSRWMRTRTERKYPRRTRS